MSADLLFKCSQILSGFNIETVYISSGHLLDSISDNMLSCILTNQKVAEINIICSGPAWTDKQLAVLYNNKDKIHGYKCNNKFALEKITQHLSAAPTK